VAIREELDVLLVHLQELQFHAKEERYFYEVRKRFNEIKRTRSPNEKVEKAALLLYLNKTCFNGLYRVNRKGEFNVPWGDYKNPRIYDKQNLSAVSAILNQPGIKISCQDFSAIERETNEGDFVYFDPPYQPLSKTSHFTSYTSESFSAANQENLSRLFHRLTEKGCYCMLSNSPGVRPLYDGDSYRVEIVKAGRAINSVGTARGPIDELLVLNYGQ
jgi:DNA adenine methylase